MFTGPPRMIGLVSIWNRPQRLQEPGSKLLRTALSRDHIGSLLKGYSFDHDSHKHMEAQEKGNSRSHN